MGLTVSKTIKCPKCGYKDSFSMRLGMGEEENAGAEEPEFVKRCEKALASEHPNHPVKAKPTASQKTKGAVKKTKAKPQTLGERLRGFGGGTAAQPGEARKFFVSDGIKKHRAEMKRRFPE